MADLYVWGVDIGEAKINLCAYRDGAEPRFRHGAVGGARSPLRLHQLFDLTCERATALYDRAKPAWIYIERPFGAGRGQEMTKALAIIEAALANVCQDVPQVEANAMVWKRKMLGRGTIDPVDYRNQALRHLGKSSPNAFSADDAAAYWLARYGWLQTTSG